MDDATQELTNTTSDVNNSSTAKPVPRVVCKCVE